MADFVYLASQSPRRRQLLEQLGIRHELLLPDAAEDSEALEIALKNEAPRAYVQRVTGLKLDAALQRITQRDLPGAPVLCSDTTVALGRTLFGKHRVLTAVALQQGGARVQALSESTVRFAPLTPALIQAYVDSGEPMGKAGAYAVQGRAAAFIAHISGSYSGIMGLPLFETAQLLRAVGVEA